MTLVKVGGTYAEERPSSPSSFWWISWVLLAIRKNPPTMRMRSRPEISWLKSVKSGVVRRITQAMEKSRTMRITIAKPRPRKRALASILAGKNGDEDNVIDAENDFQSEQRGKSHPSVWIHEPIHDLFLQPAYAVILRLDTRLTRAHRRAELRLTEYHTA